MTFPPYLLYMKGKEEYVVTSVPQETEAFERRRWKERNGLLEKEGKGPTDNSSSWGDRFLKFFVPFFCFRSRLSKKIREDNWEKGRGREAEDYKHMSNSDTLFDVFYAGTI